MKRAQSMKVAALAILWLFAGTTARAQQPIEASAHATPHGPVLKIYELRNADAREMSELLTDLLEEQARVSVDMRTNSIVVVADPEQHKIVGAVMALDESKQAKLESQTAAPKSAQLKIFSLENLPAQESAKVLANLFPQDQLRVAVDEQTNSVIVSADSQEQLSVVEAVLTRLDESARVTDRKGQSETRHFTFKYARPNDLNRRLQQVRSGVISFQITNNQVTVTGPQSALDEVEMLVRELDQPPPSRSMRLRIIWLLAATQEDPSLKSLSAPPDDLKPVLEELADLGIKDAKLATQMVLYGVSGSQNLQLNGNIRNPFPGQVEVTGELSDHPSKSPTLNLQINISGESQGLTHVGGRNPGAAMGSLNTQITTPPGHFVVLGAMPMHSLTSVFVVQVKPLEIDPDAEQEADLPTKADPAKVPPLKVRPTR